MQRVLISLEIINIAIAGLKFYESFYKSSEQIANGFNMSGSIIDCLIAILKTSKNTGRLPIAGFGAISATIDCGLSFYESAAEATEHDYDAMLSKIIAGTGAATTAVGSTVDYGCSRCIQRCDGDSR